MVETAPYSNAYESIILRLVVIYFFLFLIGVCGISSIWAGFTSIICKSRRERPRNFLQEHSFFVYIFALTIVDFMVLLTIPVLISKYMLQTFAFGEIICKLHSFLESMGKVMSGLLLAAISFDRYMKIVNPLRAFGRGVKFVCTLILVLLICSTVLLLPLPLKSHVHRIVAANSSESEDSFYFAIYECEIDYDFVNMFHIWKIALFLFCFVLPAALIMVFYSAILTTLIRSARNFGQSHIPLKKVTFYTLSLIVFYFLCWAPFWVSTILYETHRISQNVNMFIHILPYVNSSLNWVFYALLNSQFRKETTEDRVPISSKSDRRVTAEQHLKPLLRGSPSPSHSPHHHFSDNNFGNGKPLEAVVELDSGQVRSQVTYEQECSDVQL